MADRRISCRRGCAACCKVISISSPIPGMPQGKPAGITCVNLLENGQCSIHGTSEYPRVCREFQATLEYCGDTTAFAMEHLAELERLTK